VKSTEVQVGKNCKDIPLAFVTVRRTQTRREAESSQKALEKLFLAINPRKKFAAFRAFFQRME